MNVTEQTGTEGTEGHFAENVRIRREEIGWSQTDFAKRLQDAGLRNFHQTTVSRIEKNERPVRLGEARVIAHVLGRDLDLLWQPPADSQLSARLGAELGSERNARAALHQAVHAWLSQQVFLKRTIAEAESAGHRADPDGAPDSIEVKLHWAKAAVRRGIYAAIDEIMIDLGATFDGLLDG